MTLASCAVAIALLFDVSNSVSPESYTLQRNGTADALRSEAVVRAISNSPGGIAVSILEWASVGEQWVTQPWTVLQTPADAERLADRLAHMERRPGTYTALGNAMQRGSR